MGMKVWCWNCFCFLKKKTAYEWRISDGISDVCSSDLVDEDADPRRADLAHRGPRRASEYFWFTMSRMSPLIIPPGNSAQHQLRTIVPGVEATVTSPKKWMGLPAIVKSIPTDDRKSVV